MGCVCCSLSSFVSIVLDAFERVTLCTVCAMLVCCLMFTVMSMLIMGIGIGYQYCTVQTAVAAMDAAAQAAGAVRSGSARRSAQQFPVSNSGIGRGASGMGTANLSPAMKSLNRAAKKAYGPLDFGPNSRGRRDFHGLMPSNNNTINDLLISGNFTTNSTLFALTGSNLTEYNSPYLYLFNALRTNLTAFNRTELPLSAFNRTLGG